MLTKADLIDAVAGKRDGMMDRDVATAIVDAVIDTIIAKTGSPRTVDEMLRVKEGRE